MQSADMVLELQELKTQHTTQNAPSEWVSLDEVNSANVTHSKNEDCMFYSYSSNALNIAPTDSFSSASGFLQNQSYSSEKLNNIPSDDVARCMQLGCSSIHNLQDVNGYCSVYFPDRNDVEMKPQQHSGILLPEELPKLSDLSPDIISLEGSVTSELLKVVDSDDDEDLVVDGSDTESEISVSDEVITNTSFYGSGVELQCMVCGLPRSQTVEANFLQVDNNYPQTFVSKTPVFIKLVEIIPSEMNLRLNAGVNLMCRRCFNLIETAENLELSLSTVKQELCDFVQRAQRMKSFTEMNQRNMNGQVLCSFNTKNDLESTNQALQLREFHKYLNPAPYLYRDPNYSISPVKHLYDSTSLPQNFITYASAPYPTGVSIYSEPPVEPAISQVREETSTVDKTETCGKTCEEAITKMSSDQKSTEAESSTDKANVEEVKKVEVKVASDEVKVACDEVKVASDEVTTPEVRHQCDRCGRIFHRKCKLLSHLRKHIRDFRFKCEYCSKGYTYEVNLLLHLRSHKDKRPYLCESCPASFLKSQDLQSHLLFCLDKSFPCSKCPRMFVTSEKLAHHVETLHNRIVDEASLKKHECNVCGKRFRYTAELQHHLVSHEDTKSFSCELCDKSYKHKRHLKRHRKEIHENPSDKKRMKMENPIEKVDCKTICPICDKAVCRLSVHMMSHSDVKEFKCEKCSAEFTLKQGLLRHMRTKHLDPNRRRASNNEET